jgi:hypothetical protein
MYFTNAADPLEEELEDTEAVAVACVGLGVALEQPARAIHATAEAARSFGVRMTANCRGWHPEIRRSFKEPCLVS